LEAALNLNFWRSRAPERSGTMKRLLPMQPSANVEPIWVFSKISKQEQEFIESSI
jgi:hypothetical protein